MDKMIIRKYYLDIDGDNYFTKKNGKGVSLDYRDSYLFTKEEVNKIKSLHKDYCREWDTELRVTEVKPDMEFWIDVEDELLEISTTPFYKFFCDSQEDDYMENLLQQYIGSCTKYNQLVKKVARHIAKDYPKFIKPLAKEFHQKRTFAEIVRDIRANWKRIPKEIKELLCDIEKIDIYEFSYFDKGKDEVISFITDATSWFGDIAYCIKLEMVSMCYMNIEPKRLPNLYYIAEADNNKEYICDLKLKRLGKYNYNDIGNYFLITEKEAKLFKKELGKKALYHWDGLEPLKNKKYNIIPLEDCHLDDYINESAWNDEYEMYLPIAPEFQEAVSEQFDFYDCYYEDVKYRCFQKTRIVRELANSVESTIKKDERVWFEMKEELEKLLNSDDTDNNKEI